MARSLFEAAEQLASEDDLHRFLHQWRNDFQRMLTHDPGNELHGRHFPHLAQNITNEFPSMKIIRQYTTRLLAPHSGDVKHIASFEFQEPCLSEITHLCERHFFWGFYRTIIPNFQDLVWPGIVLRYFLQVFLEFSFFIKNNTNALSAFLGQSAAIAS